MSEHSFTNDIFIKTESLEEEFRALNQQLTKLHYELGKRLSQRIGQKKWEIMVLDDPSSDAMSNLGESGWELVSITSFSTGFGAMADGTGGGIFKVHFRYGFKRELLRVDDHVEIITLRERIEDVENELARVKKQADMHASGIRRQQETENQYSEILINYAPTYSNVKEAIERGRSDIIRALTAANVDLVSEVDTDKRTLLHHAVIQNSDAACLMLLRLGAIATIKDGFGKTPLDYAIQSNRHTIVTILKDG